MTLPPRLEISEVTEPAAFFSLEAEWRSLLLRTEDATPFATWEWCSTFYKHHVEGHERGRFPKRLLILRAQDGAQCLGIMPLIISPYRGTPLRQVRFLGAPLSDYQGLIGPLASREACAQAFLAHLLREKNRWDLCDFADQREGTALTVASQNGLFIENLHHRVCPVIVLEKSFDKFLSGLSKNMRTNIGRRRRQVQKTFKTEIALANVHDLDGAMADLFRLHNARWQKRGAAGAFADPRIQGFHRDVAKKFLAADLLRLHLLRLDGETRAAFYCFRYGTRIYYYLSGFDLDFAKFSIGNVAMSFAIESAINEGIVEFDLLRGDESYKFDWKAVERSTRRLVIGHDAVRSRFACLGHKLERFIELRGLAVQRYLWGRKREK